MAYDKEHTKDYYQLNIKLHLDTDADVVAFFQNVPNKRKAVCAVVREWLDPVGGYGPHSAGGDEL